MLELHWALFDSAYHTPNGSHWTWYSDALDVECLDCLYYDVLVPELGASVNVSPPEVVRQGFASVNESWCCWFKLVESGRDSHGRPGRYLMIAAFAARPLSSGFDAQQVYELPGFDALAALRHESPPLAKPKSCVTQFEPTPIAPHASNDLKLQDEKRVVQVGRGRILAATASSSPTVASWQCIELCNGDSARWAVECHPASDPVADLAYDTYPSEQEIDESGDSGEQGRVGSRGFFHRRARWLWICLLVLLAAAMIALVLRRRLGDRLIRQTSASAALVASHLHTLRCF